MKLAGTVLRAAKDRVVAVLTSKATDRSLEVIQEGLDRARREIERRKPAR